MNAVVLTEPHEGDLSFCIFHSGESCDMFELVKQTKPPAKVIVLTSAPGSHLSHIAEACISTISEEVSYGQFHT